jgi:Uma2 family endonuclease
MARPPALAKHTDFRIVLNMESVGLTDDQFMQLCLDNPDLRIEMTAGKELIIMSPTKPNTGRRNAKILQRLANWAEQHQNGEVFDSNSAFTLPNGAKRAPDVSWIQKSRWDALSEEEKDRFSEICPDFVVELRSTSDRVADIEVKMEEYIANGARLGWLLDPFEKRATIYRPGQPPQRIDNPTILGGGPVLPGFNFDFREIH